MGLGGKLLTKSNISYKIPINSIHGCTELQEGCIIIKSFYYLKNMAKTCVLMVSASQITVVLILMGFDPPAHEKLPSLFKDQGTG